MIFINSESRMRIVDRELNFHIVLLFALSRNE